jgi:hypothetical protein
MAEESSLGAVPGDVLIHLFSFFLSRSPARSTDLESARQCHIVCCSWNRSIQAKRLWAAVRISSLGDDGRDRVGLNVAWDTRLLEGMMPFMRHTTHFEFLFSSWNAELMATVLAAACTSGQNLRSLKLHSLRSLHLPDSAASFARACPYIRDLSIERSRCRDLNELGLFEALLQEWRFVERLSLRFVPVAPSTMAFLTQLRELSLTVDSAHCSPEAVEAIVTCAQLRSLSLICAPRICNFVASFAAPVRRVLQGLPGLGSLTLGKMSMDEALTSQIASSIGGSLHSLRLENCKWPQLPHFLQALAALVDLEVSNCQHLRDLELQEFSCANRRSLQRFVLRNVHRTDVTDAGLIAFAAAFPELQELCVTGDTAGSTGITDAFLLRMQGGKMLSSLRKLNLRGWYDLSEEAVEDFRRARPSVVIQWASLRFDG